MLALFRKHEIGSCVCCLFVFVFVCLDSGGFLCGILPRTPRSLRFFFFLLYIMKTDISKCKGRLQILSCSPRLFRHILEFCTASTRTKSGDGAEFLPFVLLSCLTADWWKPKPLEMLLWAPQALWASTILPLRSSLYFTWADLCGEQHSVDQQILRIFEICIYFVSWLFFAK